MFGNFFKEGSKFRSIYLSGSETHALIGTVTISVFMDICFGIDCSRALGILPSSQTKSSFSVGDRRNSSVSCRKSLQTEAS